MTGNNMHFDTDISLSGISITSYSKGKTILNQT